MELACPYNLTTLHYYIITFSLFHFPLSDFRSRNRHLCPRREKRGANGSLGWWTTSRLTSSSGRPHPRSWRSVAGYLLVAFTSYPLPFLCRSKLSEGDFVDFASKRGSGTRVVTAVKTSKEEGGRIISEKTVSKSAFFCNFAPAKH